MKKVFLLGDSIRQGYCGYVKKALSDVAEVYYPNDNCAFTGNIIRYLLDWKNELKIGKDIDLVHWNAGLWDALRMPDGKPHTPLNYYAENVERICNMIELMFPKAKMAFATSTPVQEQLFTPPFYFLPITLHCRQAVTAPIGRWDQLPNAFDTLYRIKNIPRVLN